LQRNMKEEGRSKDLYFIYVSQLKGRTRYLLYCDNLTILLQVAPSN
jgi:hypothetical protein